MDYPSNMGVDWAYLNIDAEVAHGGIQCNQHQETSFFIYDKPSGKVTYESGN